jgi:cytochrome c554/c'-like protein
VSSRAVALGLLVAVLRAAAASAQGMATADRVQGPGFWPTQGKPPLADYVGAARCASCHAPQAGQSRTAMARTLTPAAESTVLRAHPDLQARLAGHEYRIATGRGESVYTIKKDDRSLALPLGWAFGVGTVGQTWVYEKDGRFHESRASWFDAAGGLGFTPSRALESPRDLEEAAGRPLPDAEARRCFGCHTTAATTKGLFDVKRLVPGVTCEACHGPGATHVRAVEQGKLAEVKASLTTPRRAEATASVDFCGACHATWWDVTLAGEKGIAALRSQPFRLQSSRCWGEGDERLTCVACHDPHRPLVRDIAAYDARCLACHTAGQKSAKGRTARVCPVAKENCASCHMPKYEVPEMRFRFTDHLIRVVREKN